VPAILLPPISFLWGGLTGLLFGAAAMGEVCLVLQRRGRRTAYAVHDMGARVLTVALDTLSQDPAINANEALAQQVQCCHRVAASLTSKEGESA